MTPGSIVQLIVRVRSTVPTRAAKPQPNGIGGHANGTETPTEVQAAEQDIEELIGRKKAGADGEEPNYWVHAPHFPAVSTPGPFVN